MKVAWTRATLKKKIILPRSMAWHWGMPHHEKNTLKDWSLKAIITGLWKKNKKKYKTWAWKERTLET